MIWTKIGPQGPKGFAGYTTWMNGAYLIIYIAGYWTKFRNPFPRKS